MAILSLLPMAYWHEARQSGTNNTWSAVQRQLGSVVKTGPINEWACGKGQGTDIVPMHVDARESMHSDRSSPSQVLTCYKLIPACTHVQQQQYRIANNAPTPEHYRGRSVSTQSQQDRNRGGWPDPIKNKTSNLKGGLTYMYTFGHWKSTLIQMAQWWNYAHMST